MEKNMEATVMFKVLGLGGFGLCLSQLAKTLARTTWKKYRRLRRLTD